MILKIRDNIYLGDKDAYKSVEELKEKGISSIFIVADDLESPKLDINANIRVWNIGIRSDRMNPPHVKDLSTHCPKYSVQNGEIVLIQSITGLQRGAYIACRMICELEQKTIYEVMLELKQLLPEFDITKSYF